MTFWYCLIGSVAVGGIALVLSGLRYVNAGVSKLRALFSHRWAIGQACEAFSKVCTKGASDAATPHLAGHQLIVEESRPCR